MPIDAVRGPCCTAPVPHPQLYDIAYESATGPVSAIMPSQPGVPAEVHKQTYRGTTLASSTGAPRGAGAAGSLQTIQPLHLSIQIPRPDSRWIRCLS